MGKFRYFQITFSRDILASADDPASPEPSSKLKSAKIYLYIIFSLTIVQYSSKYVLNLVSCILNLVPPAYSCTYYIGSNRRYRTITI